MYARRRVVTWLAIGVLTILAGALGRLGECSEAEPADSAPRTIRVATFNVSLHRTRSGALATELAAGSSADARRIAEIIQRVRPDILLLNEFDYDAGQRAIDAFHDKYVTVSQNGQRPIHYPYRFSDEVNTGVDSGSDLNGDGRRGGPNDAFGYGLFPGQYGMAVFSRFPLLGQRARSFRKFPWHAMPGAKIPRDPSGGKPFYPPEIWKQLRLSSKSHWDLPFAIGGRQLHLLAAHPTPPVFDGAEDRNGCRNHDEIRIWADYVEPQRSGYLVDDRGTAGGLAPDALFVIAGDLNADPVDGESVTGAIAQLLNHPRINGRVEPRSAGGAEAGKRGAANLRQQGAAALDTADFGRAGNLRVDYVLPARSLNVVASGVYWPPKDSPESHLADVSDHHLVWIDLRLP